MAGRAWHELHSTILAGLPHASFVETCGAFQSCTEKSGKVVLQQGGERRTEQQVVLVLLPLSVYHVAACVSCIAARLPFFRVPSDATSLTIQQHWEHINPVAVLTTAAFLQRLKAAGVFEGASRAESGIYTVQKCSKQYLTNPIILIAVDELPDTVSALQQPISDSTEAAATHPGEVQSEAQEGRVQETLCVASTSGSTGSAQHVLLSYDAWMHRYRWQQRRYPLKPHDTLLLKASPVFVDSVWETLMAAMCGCKVVIIDHIRATIPAVLVSAVAEHSISHLLAVPQLLAAVVSAAATRLDQSTDPLQNTPQHSAIDANSSPSRSLTRETETSLNQQSLGHTEDEERYKTLKKSQPGYHNSSVECAASSAVAPKPSQSPLKSLVYIASSGDALPMQLASRLQACTSAGTVLLNIYGSAETTADCFAHQLLPVSVAALETTNADSTNANVIASDSAAMGLKAKPGTSRLQPAACSIRNTPNALTATSLAHGPRMCPIGRPMGCTKAFLLPWGDAGEATSAISPTLGMQQSYTPILRPTCLRLSASPVADFGGRRKRKDDYLTSHDSGHGSQEPDVASHDASAAHPVQSAGLSGSRQLYRLVVAGPCVATGYLSSNQASSGEVVSCEEELLHVQGLCSVSKVLLKDLCDRGLALAPEVGDQQEPPRGSSTEAEISTSFIASAPTSIESLYDIERCYITQDLVSFHEAGENGVGYCVCEGRSSSIVKVLGKHVNLLQLEAAVQVCLPDHAEAAAVATRHPLSHDTCIVVLVADGHESCSDNPSQNRPTAPPSASHSASCCYSCGSHPRKLPEALERSVREHLFSLPDPFVQPACLALVAALPRLPSGKVDRLRISQLSAWHDILSHAALTTETADAPRWLSPHPPTSPQPSRMHSTRDSRMGLQEGLLPQRTPVGSSGVNRSNTKQQSFLPHVKLGAAEVPVSKGSEVSELSIMRTCMSVLAGTGVASALEPTTNLFEAGVNSIQVAAIASLLGCRAATVFLNPSPRALKRALSPSAAEAPQQSGASPSLLSTNDGASYIRCFATENNSTDVERRDVKIGGSNPKARAQAIAEKQAQSAASDDKTRSTCLQNQDPCAALEGSGDDAQYIYHVHQCVYTCADHVEATDVRVSSSRGFQSLHRIDRRNLPASQLPDSTQVKQTSKAASPDAPAAVPQHAQLHNVRNGPLSEGKIVLDTMKACVDAPLTLIQPLPPHSSSREQVGCKDVSESPQPAPLTAAQGSTEDGSVQWLLACSHACDIACILMHSQMHEKNTPTRPTQLSTTSGYQPEDGHESDQIRSGLAASKWRSGRIWTATVGSSPDAGLQVTACVKHVVVACIKGHLEVLKLHSGERLACIDTGGQLRRAPVLDPWYGYLWMYGHSKRLQAYSCGDFALHEAPASCHADAAAPHQDSEASEAPTTGESGAADRGSGLLSHSSCSELRTVADVQLDALSSTLPRFCTAGNRQCAPALPTVTFPYRLVIVATTKPATVQGLEVMCAARGSKANSQRPSTGHQSCMHMHDSVHEEADQLEVQKLWETTVGFPVFSSPAIVYRTAHATAACIVVFSTVHSQVCAVDACSGVVLWKTDLPGQVFADLVIGLFHEDTKHASHRDCLHESPVPDGVTSEWCCVSRKAHLLVAANCPGRIVALNVSDGSTLQDVDRASSAVIASAPASLLCACAASSAFKHQKLLQSHNLSQNVTDPHYLISYSDGVNQLVTVNGFKLNDDDLNVNSGRGNVAFKCGVESFSGVLWLDSQTAIVGCRDNTVRLHRVF